MKPPKRRPFAVLDAMILVAATAVGFSILPSMFFNPTAIMGGWLALWFSGRWRAEPGWIDRMSQVVGWEWITCFLFHQYFMMIDGE